MSTNVSPPQFAQTAKRRFTLMLSGEDALDDENIQDQAPRGLPHERYLLGKQVPLAPILLLGQSNQALDPNQVIACLQPVHLHATRDHLVLMGQNQIDLTERESSQLLQVALPFIEEDFQNAVLFHDASYWFIPAGPFASLITYSVDQALGRNIDWWMPRDLNEAGIAKRWRKLQNEIQMLWHIDSVNQEREQRGLPSINSLWISGLGKLSYVEVPKTITQSQKIFGQHPLLKGLARYLDLPYHPTIDDQELVGGFAWLDLPQDIWPLLSKALLSKAIDELMIIDFPHGKPRERIFTAKDLHKKSWAFWKKPEPLVWRDIIPS